MPYTCSYCTWKMGSSQEVRAVQHHGYLPAHTYSRTTADSTGRSLTEYYSQLPAHYMLPTTHYSLLPAHYIRPAHNCCPLASQRLC